MKRKQSVKIIIITILTLFILFPSFNANDSPSMDTTDSNFTISNVGSGNNWNNLCCGELISLPIVNNSLTPDEDYFVKVWNGTHWNDLYDIGSTDNTDYYGDIAIQFHVPGWSELGKNPLENAGDAGLSKGQYNISLFDEHGDSTPTFPGLNKTIQIRNLYDILFMYDGEEIDYLLQGAQYNDFYIFVRNWTGSNGWENNVDYNGNWNLVISAPNNNPADFPLVENSINTHFKRVDLQIYAQYMPPSPNNYEYFYTVNITNSINPSYYSNITLPIKLDMTTYTIQQINWGDYLFIDGYLLNGNGTGMMGYPVRLYAPTANGPNGSYVLAYSTDTYSTGRYSMSIETGPDSGYSSGTWYLGTYDTGSNPPRIDESNFMPYVPNFIPYFSFAVQPKDDTEITITNAEYIVTGSEQTINVSVYNHSWMWSGPDDTINEYQYMNFHVTNIKGYDKTKSKEYTATDIAPVTATLTKIDPNEKYAYYEFNYTFNETGTATILASWPENLTSYQGCDSSYSNTYYDSTQIMNNITGSTSIQVITLKEMNLVVIGDMVDSVQIVEDGDLWVNASQFFTLNVFGNASDKPMNATITITGCGLHITIDEQDTVAENKHLIAKSTGYYNISIQPKTEGILTITAINQTTTLTCQKNFTITGLNGTITTSNNDDRAITVGTTETITAVVTNGNYGEVHVTYVDLNWANPICINSTIGEGTAGNGLHGIFTFNPNPQIIDHMGYIIVAEKAGSSSYMYDTIEIKPIYDLLIELIEPSPDALPIEVGIEYDFILQLLGPDGNPVEYDSPSVVGKLTDADHDEDNPLQIIYFADSGDNWEADNVLLWQPGTLIISGYNASDGMRHQANISITVKGNDPPISSFNYNPAKPIINEQIQFTDTSTDPDGYIVNWSWIFDDGFGSYEQHPTHIYDDYGTYTVDLTVMDDKGAINTTSKNIIIKKESSNTNSGSGSPGGNPPPSAPTNQPPIADLTIAEPYTGFVGEEIIFNASNSTDPDGTIQEWFWDFGDNTNGSGKIISHTYNQSGTYIVTLYVIDDQGSLDDENTQVIITQPNRPPTSPQITGPRTGKKQNDITFSIVSTDADNDTLRYIIDWDDGTTNTITNYTKQGAQLNVTHKWISSGVYLITIFAEDMQNATSQIKEYLLLIDANVLFINGDLEGYLIDYEIDGIYNAFHDNITNNNLEIKKEDNNTYMIDNNSDGTWDYVVNLKGEIQSYKQYENKIIDNTPGFEILCLIISIILLIILNRKKMKHD